MALPMAAWRLSTTPGTWLVLSGPTSLVVMMAPPASMSALVQQLWEDTLATTDADGLFRFVADAGIDAMPHFGAFFWDAKGLHGLTRGDVRLTDAQGDVALEGRGAITWTEELLDAEATYTVTLEPVPDDAPALPLVVGAALVSSVTLTCAKDQLLRFPDGGSTGVLRKVPGLGLRPRRRPAEPVAAPAPQPSPDPQPGPEPEAKPQPDLDADTEHDGLEVTPFDASALDETPSASSPASPEPEPEAAPSAEPAHEPEPEPEQPMQEPLGVVSAVPPPSSRQAPVVVPGNFGEVDDDPGTILDVDIAATHKPKDEQAPDAQVLAVPCAQGHPNPPGARTCRVCPAPVDSSNPRLVRRPVLAGVNTNHGDFADVTPAVVVGRAPDAGKGPHGSSLLRVPSPGNDISRSHLLVSTKDWNVVITDLHSTNGTLVRPVGEEEFELRDGRSVSVELGTILELGDGVSLRIEPPRSSW